MSSRVRERFPSGESLVVVPGGDSEPEVGDAGRDIGREAFRDVVDAAGHDEVGAALGAFTIECDSALGVDRGREFRQTRHRGPDRCQRDDRVHPEHMGKLEALEASRGRPPGFIEHLRDVRHASTCAAAETRSKLTQHRGDGSGHTNRHDC